MNGKPFFSFWHGTGYPDNPLSWSWAHDIFLSVCLALPVLVILVAGVTLIAVLIAEVIGDGQSDKEND